MADSANILSILAALGQSQPPVDPSQSGNYYPPADPTNVLQAAAPPQISAPILDVPAAPPVSLQTPPAAPPAPENHPRKRQSAIDVIGRLADVFAKVGGAEALYQPTLDSREDRTLALGDHARKVDADTISLATDKFKLGDLQTARVGQFARGLKAIQASGGDINQALPVLAQQMQIDPQTVQLLQQEITTNPNAIDALVAATTDPKLAQSKYGGSVVYATGPDGKLAAFQPGLGDEAGRNILPEGYTPIDPLKYVDTGGAVVGTGTRSDRIGRIIPKTARPDTIITTQAQRDIAAGHDRTQIQIAGMPARGKGGTGATGDTSTFITTAQDNLDELRNIYGNLKKMGAMVSPTQSTAQNIEARARASGLGQAVEGTVGTEAQTLRDRVNSIRPQLMQSIAKATGMTGKQLDSNADVKLFMQTVTNPASSYEANIRAIAGLERFLKANAKKPTAAAPAKSSGWSIVGVK